MDGADVLLQAGPVSEEFRCDLKDRRRDARVVTIAEALAERPSESFAEVFEDPSDLEAVYRLLGNDNVGFEALLEGHVEATRKRAGALGRVVMIHDTTEFAWTRREVVRWGLGVMSSSRQGFLAHASVVASADGVRCPLGCARMRPYVRARDLQSDEERSWWSEHHPSWGSEHDRWLEAVVATEEAYRDVAKLVHVMDREGDAYELFHLLWSHQWSFVIRLAQLRRVFDPETKTCCTIDKALARARVCAERTITISERVDAGRPPYARKTFPAREGREARISIRACSVEMRRPQARKDLEHLEDRIPVNLVEVVELEPPEGQEPVHWMLVTTEPTETVEQVLQVVDLYRTRWLIEEYFKSIKTGCSYGKRQMESIESLLNVLAITLPIAWRLLVLRHLEREAGDAPARAVVSDVQLVLLQRRAKKCKWSSEPTVSEVLRAVARLGGHQPRNGPPGWQVLGRDWAKLMSLEAGYRLAVEMKEAM